MRPPREILAEIQVVEGQLEALIAEYTQAIRAITPASYSAAQAAEIVGKYHRIPPKHILGRHRDHFVSWCRFQCYAILKDQGLCNYHIGLAFKRHHGAIDNGLRKWRDRATKGPKEFMHL